MKKKNQYSHHRVGSVKISISLPEDLRDAIKRQADAENRTLSNMIAVLVKRAADQRQR